MYRELERVRLKDGDEVEAGVVVGPDLEWAARVEDLLSHKGRSGVGETKWRCATTSVSTSSTTSCIGTECHLQI